MSCPSVLLSCSVTSGCWCCLALQFMTEYAVLSVKGNVPVHITGYYSPEYGPDGDDEGEEEEEEYALVRTLNLL